MIIKIIYHIILYILYIQSPPTDKSKKLGNIKDKPDKK